MRQLDLMLLAGERAKYEKLRAREVAQSRQYNDFAETAALLGDNERAAYFDQKELHHARAGMYYSDIVDSIDTIIDVLKQGYKAVTDYNKLVKDDIQKFDITIIEGV